LSYFHKENRPGDIQTDFKEPADCSSYFSIASAKTSVLIYYEERTPHAVLGESDHNLNYTISVTCH